MTETIQKYNPQTGLLTKSQQYKIRKLVEHKCIERLGEDTWIVKPIPGYNSTTYTITRGMTGQLSCNCQFFATKQTDCSHIGAMILAGGLTMPTKVNKETSGQLCLNF